MIRRFAACLFVLMLAELMSADDGMWLFNAVPKAKIKAKYGFEPAQPWLDHLRLSSVRMGDSGSFVSPQGLILTNHHVGRSCIVAASTREKDLMQSGFYAKSPAEELRCPGLEVEVLQNIEDVTAKVSAAAKPHMNPTQVANARRTAVDAIIRQCAKAEINCEMVELYGSALHHLYRYKKYSDVRLVFAPEFATAFFGGDPDNYTFPRYDLDITFFRVYENGRPIDSENYLKFSTRGTQEGSLVFTAGNPSSTARFSTLAQMEFLRDVVYPGQIKSLNRRAKLLKEYGAKSPENAHMVEPMVWDIENRLKAIKGYQSGLLDKELMAKKAAEEQQLRAAYPKKRAIFGDPWADLESAIAKQRKFEWERHYSETVGLTGRLAFYARTLVRSSAERSKPNSVRLPEFREASRSMTERDLFSNATIDKQLEEITLTDSLSQLLDDLGADDELVQKVLAGKTPADRAHELIANTKLDDLQVRKKLLQGGEAAIDASTDPLIVLQKAVDPEARAARKRAAGSGGAAALTRLRAAIGEETFSQTGMTTSPDATGNLRLSYGVVKGSNDPAFTTMAEAFSYAEKKGNKPPYQLPASWWRSKDKINLETPLNQVSTVDVIGGNSGGPLVDAKGELVGVVFDANLPMLAGRFVRKDETARATSVDSRAIIEALRKIYGADALANELTGEDVRTK